MASNNYTNEKSRLREFLERRGVHLSANRPPILKCPNPGHGSDGHDAHDSAVLYDNQDVPMVHCPVCGENWNIFGVAGLLDNIPNTKEDFPKLLKAVRDTLRIAMTEKTEKPKLKEKNPVSFPTDEESKKSIDAKIKSLTEKHGEIKGSWKYQDKDGNLIALDVRFEKEGERKVILTFWWDGKSLKWSGSHVFIYNLQEVVKNENNKPILIVEGAKCVDNAKVLDKFVTCSWSGGCGKVSLSDWTILKMSEVFILPDDDKPGLEAAQKIRLKITQSKIVRPIEAARSIKPKGADIVEALQIMSPDDLAAYILNPENHLEGIEKSPVSTPDALQQGGKEGLPPPPDAGDSSMPFKIMGIGDDGKANFITEAGRLFQSSLESISKGKLMVLAHRPFWMQNYKSDEGKVSWDWAIDEIIRFSQNKDFDGDCIRGRGAWKDGDKISYHDGINTYGEYDKKKIYLRLPKKDIGINSKPIDKESIDSIKKAIFKLSFETPADAVRCLGWSVLAPFAGALKFRPAILLTGTSGSGKSTVANMIIRRISSCLWLNGAESTPAFVRQKVNKDSVSVILDETEADTEKKRINRSELFSLMRASTSDDSPDSGKGGKDGIPITYKMQNMFGFIAIDPTVESGADENRIFRINMIKNKQRDWKSIEKQLKNLLSDNVCDRIRSLIWIKLKIIISLAEKIVDNIQEKTDRDFRSSYGDALLISAYIVIWNFIDEPTQNQIQDMLDKYYQYIPQDEHRDESDEMLHLIMNFVVEIQNENNQRQKLTVIECLYKIYEYRDDPKAFSDPYRLQLSRIGIKLTKENQVAIMNDSQQIKFIVKQDTGYSKILKRNKGFIKNDVPEYFSHDKRTHKCTVIKGLLKFEDEQQKIIEEGEIPF